MKAILEFDLNEPDDIQAHLRCVKSLDLVLFILKIEGELRGKLKHGNLTDCQYETLDKFRGIQFDTITIDDSMISELPYYDFGDVMSEKLSDKKNSIVIRQKELICDNDELKSKLDLEAETYYFVGMYDDNPQFRKGVNHILCSNEDTPIVC